MGQTQYIDCELSFLNDREAEYLDDKDFSGSRKAYGRVAGDELTLQTINTLNEWVQKYPDCCHRDELLLLGSHLYRLAFDTKCDPPSSPLERPLLHAFERTLQRLKAFPKISDVRMRIKLIFHKEAKVLAGLPWEFLSLPDGDFVVSRAELILTRFVPEQEWGNRHVEEDNAKLRILVVTAEPQDPGLGSIHNEDLVKQIGALRSESIDVRVFDKRPTLALLRECISGSYKEPGYRPHIFHFMGHGREGVLALLKEEEQLTAERLDANVRERRGEKPSPVEEAQWFDVESIKSLFEHKPRVVFLHACKGAAPDSLKGFSSMARSLAYSNIPAVIAMQYAIGNSEANRFAESFYRCLHQGSPVDEAVAQARCELGMFPGREVWDDRCFGTPVIYLQTKEPVMRRGAVTKSAPDSDVGTTGAIGLRKVPCPNPLCKGLVIEGRTLCLACKKGIMRCPVCEVAMLTEMGLCDNGHSSAVKPSSQAAPHEPGGLDQKPRASLGTGEDIPSIEGSRWIAERQKSSRLNLGNENG
jgi:hypothetical protein